MIFLPEYSVVSLTFPFLSAIQTTQKNFVTAVDDKKIGIVETLVGPSTMITQDLEDSKYSFKTFPSKGDVSQKEQRRVLGDEIVPGALARRQKVGFLSVIARSKLFLKVLDINDIDLMHI